MGTGIAGGWSELRSLFTDPTAEEAYAFVQQVERLQGLFRPGWLQVRSCEVVPLESGAEKYHGVLQARHVSGISGQLLPTEIVVVRATFERPPRSDDTARFACTYLSIGTMQLGNGVVEGRGLGYDITYSAFSSTSGGRMHRVRIPNFPNGWRRTLRYAVLAKLLEWQLGQCQQELEKVRQALTVQEDKNS
jgi:hypothetical protein